MYCINIMALTFLCLFVSLSLSESVSLSVSGLKQLEICEAAGISSCEQFRTDAASTRSYCQAIRLLHLLNKITDLLPLQGQIHPCKQHLCILGHHGTMEIGFIIIIIIIIIIIRVMWRPALCLVMTIRASSKSETHSFERPS